MRTLLAFVRLPTAARAQAIEALVLLLCARALVAGVPMRRWRQRVATTPPGIAESDSAIPGDGLDRVRGLCQIVRKVARRAPFRAVCLPQAMAAQWMLRRRGIPSRLVFGARRRSDAELEFHAWLSVGAETVLGGEEQATWSAFEPEGTQLR